MEIMGVSFDVTLVCGGPLIVGAPISAELHHAKVRVFARKQSASGLIRYTEGKWTEETKAKGIESLKDLETLLDKVLANVGELSSKHVRRAYNLGGKKDVEEPGPRARPGDRHYINLQRVTISRGRNDEINMPFWRGRLSEVTGWSLGRWGVGEYDGPDTERTVARAEEPRAV